MRKYPIKRKTNDEHDEMNSKSNVNNLGKVQRNFVTNPGKFFKFKRDRSASGFSCFVCSGLVINSRFQKRNRARQGRTVYAIGYFKLICFCHIT